MNDATRFSLPSALTHLGWAGNSTEQLTPAEYDECADTLALLVWSLALDEANSRPNQRFGAGFTLTLARLVGVVLSKLADGLPLDDPEMTDQSLCHERQPRPVETALTALVAVKRTQLSGVQS